MPTTLKELKPEKPLATTHALVGLVVSQAMEPVVVHSVTVVQVEIAAVIGNKRKPVTASPTDRQVTGPTTRKVVTMRDAWPIAACIAIDNTAHDPWHGRSAIQVRDVPHSSDVVDLLLETTATQVPDCISRHNHHPVACVSSPVPEDHASTATLLEHLKPHMMLPFDQAPIRLRVAHAMEAIVVYSVTVVNVQLAAIIGSNREAIDAWTIDD
jgi:hypothetical protein